MKMDEIVQQKLRFIFNDETIIFDKSRFVGGLTNYNYIMNIHGKDYVVRKPGGMTNQMIDRHIEKVNNFLATELGLNSNCVYFDEISGIKISEYIKDSKNVAQADPYSPENLTSVSRLMQKIHSSPKKFVNIFDWKDELHKYEQIVKELNGGFFYDYQDLKDKLFDFVDNNIKYTRSVPCHNDTIPENFIVNNKGRTYLIDWEYAGMNDPNWDVAAYILEAKLGEETVQYLLMDYYGQFPSEVEVMKIKCYMLAQDLLWTVWALIRHYNGDDFLDYCHIRYERFRKNIKELTATSDYAITEMVKD